MGSSMKKISVMIGGSLLILGATTGVWYQANEELKQKEGLVKSFTTLNGIDISAKSYSVLQQILEDKLETLKEQTLTVQIKDQVYEMSLKDLDFDLTISPQELFQQMKQDQWSDSYIERLFSLRQVDAFNYEVKFKWDEAKLKAWIEAMAKDVNQSLILPELSFNHGTFKVTEGRDAYELDQEGLYRRLTNLITKATHGETELSLEATLFKAESRAELYQQLKSVNQKVSTFTSVYPIEDKNRSFNLELATSKLNGTMILPGEEFSFTKTVAPVTTEMGYLPATVFIDGKSVDDIGGGICQVSSTLYNVQLQAGILPTERRNHSLRVYYVPIGQDATMYEGSIDYKFKNTLDYPIYIEAKANSGLLEISFWSSEKALKGVRYLPKTTVSADGLKAETTLYGYDEAGRLVYQKFLHTSQYKG